IMYNAFMSFSFLVMKFIIIPAVVNGLIYILYKQLKTWEDAQNYCRTHHYDLATIQNNENWTKLLEAADEQRFYGFAWIGLFNDINGWRWSYNDESLVFESWGLCVIIYPNGAWDDFYCTIEKYFVNE
uniref:C-type lectin domain-containing protein n=1 Tax=Cyprinus carpio TaxID=7962 RepID=A0A8C2FBU2_CYPCA